MNSETVVSDIHVRHRTVTKSASVSRLRLSTATWMTALVSLSAASTRDSLSPTASPRLSVTDTRTMTDSLREWMHWEGFCENLGTEALGKEDVLVVETSNGDTARQSSLGTRDSTGAQRRMGWPSQVLLAYSERDRSRWKPERVCTVPWTPPLNDERVNYDFPRSSGTRGRRRTES